MKNTPTYPAGTIIVEIPHQSPARVFRTADEMTDTQARDGHHDLHSGHLFTSDAEALAWARAYRGTVRQYGPNGGHQAVRVLRLLHELLGTDTEQDN